MVHSALLDRLYSFVFVACRIFLLLMVAIVSIVVFGRYVLRTTPGWGEELALFCMTWFGMLSAALAEYDNRHIRIQALDALLPKKVNYVLHLFFYLCKIIFSAILLIEGAKLTYLTRASVMSGIKMSWMWLYLSAPVTGLFLLLFLLGRIRLEVSHD